MATRIASSLPRIGTVIIGLWLAGCAQAPTSPSVQASPGPGKSFDAFQSDVAGCKQFAGSQVAGQAEAANQAAGAATLAAMMTGGTPDQTQVGGTQQAVIQQEYDNAYAQCMSAHGDVVAGYAPPTSQYGAGSAGPEADPLVRSIQRELIRLGYLRGSADGYMGPKTGGAIRSFEQANGMAVSAAASPQLLARLQATPTSTGVAAAPAPVASSKWVAPVTTNSAGSTTAASTGAAPASGWVSPSTSP